MADDEEVPARNNDEGTDTKPLMEEITDEEAIAKAKENQAKMNAMLKERRERQQAENPDQSFEDFDNSDGPQGEISYRVCADFWCKFVFITLILILAQMAKSNNEPCGIDPVSWVEGYFAILLLMSFLQVLSWFFYKCSCSSMCIGIWLGATAILSLYLLVVWIIYGYTVYFSPENDCQSSHDNFGWLIIMVILLFFGFGVILVSVGLICLLCCFCALSSSSEPSMGQQTHTQKLLDNPGAKIFYDPSLYPSQKPQCEICLMDYEKGDKIIVLPCHPTHFFHDECIQQLVDTQVDKREVARCPKCRTIIGEKQEGAGDDDKKKDEENKDEENKD